MHRLLSLIPQEDWIINNFTDGQGKCCFIGHYTRLTSYDPNDYSHDNCGDWEASEARTLTRKFLKENHFVTGDGAMINNVNNINGYTEDNPKDRVMDLLKDMIKAGY